MKRLHVIAAAAPWLLSAAPVVAETPVSWSRAAFSAFVYDFVGSAITTDPNGKSRQQVIMRGHTTTTGTKTRIDINDAGSVSESMRGSYILLTDGGRRALWVTPATRQYRETDPASLLGGFGALGQGSNGLITMTASNVHVDAEKVGPGPTIQGHNTVHYRLYQSMDMKTKVFNKTLTTRDESITDYYYATDVPNVINPFLSSAPSIPQDGALVFSDDYVRQLRTATDKLYQGGAPLRTIVSDKTTDEFGHVQSVVTTTDMMNLKQMDVSSAVFDIPLGFTATASHVSFLDEQGNATPSLPVSSYTMPAPVAHLPASAQSAIQSMVTTPVTTTSSKPVINTLPSAPSPPYSD